jgi:signal-transduction protein with cAMP-binding, CBS, and nucleotidyltransferase domain
MRMLGIRLTDPIGRLVGDPVATIRSTDTLRDAARALAAEGLGLLVVVDHRGVMGVLSERDVVAAIADDVDLDTERVRDHASTEVVSVEEDATVFDAAAAMATAEVRHLAFARHGVVTGVVSVRDVVNVLLESTDLQTDPA